MAISAQQFKVPSVRFPVFKAAAPNHAGFVSRLLGRVNVVDIQSADIRKTAPYALAAEAFDKSEFSSPIRRRLVNARTVLVPIILLASTGTELSFAWATALLTLPIAAPAMRQVAGLTTKLPGSVAEAVGVHFGLLAAMRTGDGRRFSSHSPIISQCIGKSEPKYFDIACRRIEEAYKQPDFFVEPAAKPVQLNLVEAAE